MATTFTLQHYRNMLRVNKHRLDDELELQASLMDSISSHVAKLNSQMLEAKDALAHTEAELFGDIKDSGEKTPNELVSAKVKLSPLRHKAFQRLQVARAEYEEWLGLLEAWKTRGYQLKTLADLYMANYFTVSSIQRHSPPAEPTPEAPAPRRAAPALIPTGGGTLHSSPGLRPPSPQDAPLLPRRRI